ncbi:MAG: hypothetical protein OTI36_01855 [Beijerinckiaceae bacterium]|nr:hypothetical protein [Beijerinckiaceae bacterium]
MRNMPFIRAAAVTTLVAAAMLSMSDANARGFGGGFHGGGFHSGGFHGGSFHGGGFGGYRSVHYGAFRSGHGGSRIGHSFLLENQSNPVFATGF